MKNLSLKLLCLSVVFIFCLVPLSAADFAHDNAIQNVNLADNVNDEAYYLNVDVDDVCFRELVEINIDTNVPNSIVNYYIYNGSTCLTSHEMDVKDGIGYEKMKDLLWPGNYTAKVVFINKQGSRMCVGTDDFEVKESAESM